MDCYYRDPSRYNLYNSSFSLPESAAIICFQVLKGLYTSECSAMGWISVEMEICARNIFCIVSRDFFLPGCWVRVSGVTIQLCNNQKGSIILQMCLLLKQIVVRSFYWLISLKMRRKFWISIFFSSIQVIKPFLNFRLPLYRQEIRATRKQINKQKLKIHDVFYATVDQNATKKGYWSSQLEI